MNLPEWMLAETFRVEHNPNCPSPFLVRLIGRGRGYIRGTSDDACGYGKTIGEAADNARKEAKRDRSRGAA